MRFVHSAVAIAAILTAGSASAATVFFNGFDAENGGASQVNFTGFTGLAVGSGSVDLIANGNFGITCAGNAGSCVDLNGSTNQTSRLELTSLAFDADTIYTFSFDLSGNQRGGPDNTWFVGVRFDAVNQYNFFRRGGAFGDSDSFQGLLTTASATGGSTASAAVFQNYSIGFSVKNAGSAVFFIGSSDVSNAGPIVDNVLITSAAVSEPASWALLIAGFGLTGAAMRRRGVATAA